MITSFAAAALRMRRLNRGACRMASSRVNLLSAVVLCCLVQALVPAMAGAAAQPPERTLMGIRIFDKASLVLKKFGAPAKIMSGGAAPAGSTPAAAAPQQGPPRPGSEFSTPGGGQPAPTATTAPSGPPVQIVYEYNTKAGTTLDFTISTDGRVIQISAAGQKNAEVKTLRGVTLGTTYIDVINKYGYPESQDVDNAVITMRYVDKAHVAFQLFNQKVVSVTVAAVE